MSISRLLLYSAGASLPFVFGGDGVLLTPFAVFPILGLCVSAAAAVAHRRVGTLPRHVLFALVVFTIPTLGVLMSGAHNEAVKRWLYHALGLMAFLAMAEHMRTGRIRWRDVLIGSNLFAFALGMYFVTTSALAFRENGFAETIAQRYVGGLMSLPWGTTNLVAGVLMFPTLVAIALLTSEDKLVRVTAVAGAAAGVVAIAVTLSRTSIAVAAAAATVLVVTQFRRRGYRAAILALAALVVVGAGTVSDDHSGYAPSLVAAFRERWDKRSSTLNGRTDIWNEYEGEIRRSSGVELMFGHGLYMSYVNNGFSTHNLFLSLFYDVGLIGLALSAVLGARFLFIIRRAPLAFPLTVACAAVFTCSMVEDIMYAQQSILYGWVMAAAIAGVAATTPRRSGVV